MKADNVKRVDMTPVDVQQVCRVASSSVFFPFFVSRHFERGLFHLLSFGSASKFLRKRRLRSRRIDTRKLQNDCYLYTVLVGKLSHW